MDILYLLIPLSVLGVFGVMAVFAWALHRGQFDDLEREGERIFSEADAPAASQASGENSDTGTSLPARAPSLDDDQAPLRRPL